MNKQIRSKSWKFCLSQKYEALINDTDFNEEKLRFDAFDSQTKSEWSTPSINFFRCSEKLEESPPSYFWRVLFLYICFNIKLFLF